MAKVRVTFLYRLRRGGYAKFFVSLKGGSGYLTQFTAAGGGVLVEARYLLEWWGSIELF